MRTFPDYSLYLCTDRTLMSSPSLEECVEQAVSGGCSVVQLREKDCSSLEFFNLACRVKIVLDAYSVPLIINDRVDIALAVGADGVHIGQSDLPLEPVRRLMGDERIVGVSVGTREEAVDAVRGGADYLGVGAMFATGTKTDASLVTMEELGRIRESVSVPLVVIGGINAATLPLFRGTGIDGIAVVSAIVSQPDVAAAAAELARRFRNLKLEEDKRSCI